MTRALVMAIGPALIGVGLVAVALGRERAERHVVEMRGFAFEPARIAVGMGDTIEFVNRDALPHTATARGAWDSGEMKGGARWLLVPESAGVVDYMCAYHPTMRGRIEVR